MKKTVLVSNTFHGFSMVDGNHFWQKDIDTSSHNDKNSF